MISNNLKDLIAVPGIKNMSSDEIMNIIEASGIDTDLYAASVTPIDNALLYDEFIGSLAECVEFVKDELLASPDTLTDVDASIVEIKTPIMEIVGNLIHGGGLNYIEGDMALWINNDWLDSNLVDTEIKGNNEEVVKEIQAIYDDAGLEYNQYYADELEAERTIDVDDLDIDYNAEDEDADWYDTEWQEEEDWTEADLPEDGNILGESKLNEAHFDPFEDFENNSIEDYIRTPAWQFDQAGLDKWSFINSLRSRRYWADRKADRAEQMKKIVYDKTVDNRPEEAKTFWDAARNNELNVEAFHRAFDADLEENNLLNLFTSEGKLKNRGCYGEIKRLDPGLKLTRALKKFWALQYK